MKKYKVLFDIEAENDLFEIYSFVAFNDPVEKADVLFSALRKTCYKLTSFPLRGHIQPELAEIGVKDFREIHYKPFRIIYSVGNKHVFVHCVLDGRRDIQTILKERMLRQ